MKIVVLTFTHNNNYGASLQCYALTKYLLDRGHSVQQLLVPHLHQQKRSLLYRVLAEIKSMIWTVGSFIKHCGKIKLDPDYVIMPMSKAEKEGRPAYLKQCEQLFNKFYDEYIPFFTKPCFTEREILDLNLNADLYIVGSDQVWNPVITRDQKKIFFFSFLPDTTKRISLAGCFGGSEVWRVDKQETAEIKKLLGKFSGVSVRDNIAKNILKNVFDTDSLIVLDPSFLLEAKEYAEIAKHSNLEGQGCLFLNKFMINDQWLECFKTFSKDLGVKLAANGEYKHLSGIDYQPLLDVPGWLKMVQTSEFVITDSFHCTVFCIIFRKQFISAPGYAGGEGRMITFLSELGLSDRYLKSTADFKKNSMRCKEPIDYDAVYKLLDEKKLMTKEFLNKYLS